MLIPKSSTRRGSSGPRTPRGKSKSSQNSRTHSIFVDRVLREEETAAALLYAEIQTEFRLEGATELRIGRELVQNELQARRIEQFAVQESIKAKRLALSYVEVRSHSFRYPIPKEHQNEPGYLTRLRPRPCIAFLTQLKEAVEIRGPRPDEDLLFVRLIYGDQLTDPAEAIIIRYLILKDREDDKGDENTKKREIADDQTLILEAIETEIEAQQVLQKLAALAELLGPAWDSAALPPHEIDDRIERYLTANTRKMDRSLAILETIRRLKKEA
jgi:hypothetical protein